MKIILKYEKFFKKEFLKKLIPLITVIVVIIVSIIGVMLSNRKTITIVTNGQKVKLVTYKNSVRQVLEANKIVLDSKDKTVPPLNSKLKNNQSIILKKAINIDVYVDGKKLNIKSAENNIASLLKSEKISLSKHDSIYPRINTPLTDGLKIKITRINIKTFKKLEQMGYKVLTKVNPRLPNTTKKIAHEGRNGVKQLTIQVVYHNGKVFSNKILKQAVIKKTIDKLIVLGGYPLMPVGNNGKILAYSKKFIARATAYWAVRGVGRTFTGSGRRAIRNPRGYSTIAVDKKLFPYGTKLFIEGYGFAVAADTGTAIVGNTIDVFFNTRAEACNWAVKHPYVYVLK